MKAKVKFILGACGSPYNLPYLAGMTAEIDPQLAVRLIKDGIAEPVATKMQTETATLKKSVRPTKKKK